MTNLWLKIRNYKFPNFVKNHLTACKCSGIISLALIGELVKRTRCGSI
jgi:hypothetical protein